MNIVREKKLTNMRASTSEEGIHLLPGPPPLARAGARVDPRGRAARGHAPEPPHSASGCWQPTSGPGTGSRAAETGSALPRPRNALPPQALYRFGRCSGGRAPWRADTVMSTFLQPSWTRPESSASPGLGAGAGAAGDSSGSAASLLLSQGGVGRTDSRRIALGLAALALVSAAILNVGIYQSERTALAERRWEQLARGTDTKRNEVRERIWHLAAPERVRGREPGAGALGRTRGQGRMECRREAGAAARAGAHRAGARAPSRGSDRSFGRAAGREPRCARYRVGRRAGPGAQGARERWQPRGSLPRQGGRGAPDRDRLRGADSGGSARKPVLVPVGLADEALAPLLATDWVMPGWPGTPTWWRRRAWWISLLTPPQRGAPSPGSIPAGDPQARAAALAASGVESNVEMKGATVKSSGRPPVSCPSWAGGWWARCRAAP